MTHKVMAPKLKFAFASFVVSLLISMSLMELTGGILLLCFLIALFLRKISIRQAFPEKILNWGIVAWVVILGIGFWANFFFNGHIGAPWFHRLAEFRWYLYMFAIFYLLNQSGWSGELPRWLLIFLIVVSTYGFLTFALQKDLISGQTDYGGVFRIGGPFADPMVFSQCLNFFVCFLWGYFLLDPKKSLHDRIFSAALILSTANLILTFTRGVWISFFIALLVGAILKSWKLAAKILVGVLIAATLAFALVKPIQDRILLSLDPSTSYDSERLVLWKTNFYIFLENPFFGLGYGENRRYLRDYYDKLGVPEGQFEGHAHNQYLHFLAGTGVTGFLMYFFFLFFFLRASYVVFRGAKSESIRAAALGLFLAQLSFIGAGMTEANFEHARVKYVLILCWALVLWLRQKMKESNETFELRP